MQSNKSYHNRQNQNQIQSTSKAQDKFSVKSKYNDVWATILFLLTMIAFSVLFYFGLKRIQTEKNAPASENAPSSMKDVGISIGISAVLSIFINLIYYILMQK